MPGYPSFSNFLPSWTHFSFPGLLRYTLKNSFLFLRIIKLSFQLPTQAKEIGAATWGNLYVWCCLRKEGCLEGNMPWGSFVLHISVIFTIFLSWCWFLLFGHRWHDPKFSNTLQYMSILSRKVVRNELGSNWNNFLSISVKAFVWVLPFPPVPSESLSYQYQFACQTFWMILFPVTLQILLFFRSPSFFVYIAGLFIDPLNCSSSVLTLQIQLIPNSEPTDQGIPAAPADTPLASCPCSCVPLPLLLTKDLVIGAQEKKGTSIQM